MTIIDAILILQCLNLIITLWMIKAIHSLVTIIVDIPDYVVNYTQCVSGLSDEEVFELMHENARKKADKKREDA